MLSFPRTRESQDSCKGATIMRLARQISFLATAGVILLYVLNSGMGFLTTEHAIYLRYLGSILLFISGFFYLMRERAAASERMRETPSRPTIPRTKIITFGCFLIVLSLAVLIGARVTVSAAGDLPLPINVVSVFLFCVGASLIGLAIYRPTFLQRLLKSR